MDVNKIEELIKVLELSKAEELTVSKGDCTVAIRKGAKAKSSSEKKSKSREAAVSNTVPPEPEKYYIKAPMVGIFHASNELLKVGNSIQKGQVVGAIESMKLLNEVVSEVSGVIKELLVEDGMPVEYGQPLCQVEAA